MATYEEKNRAIEMLANEGMSFEQFQTMLDVMYTDNKVYLLDVLYQKMSEESVDGENLTTRSLMMKSVGGMRSLLDRSFQ